MSNFLPTYSREHIELEIAIGRKMAELLPATTDPENNFDWQVQTNLTIKAKLDELREIVYTELNDEQHAARLALRAMDDVQRYMEIAVSVVKPTESETNDL